MATLTTCQLSLKTAPRRQTRTRLPPSAWAYREKFGKRSSLTPRCSPPSAHHKEEQEHPTFCSPMSQAILTPQFPGHSGPAAVLKEADVPGTVFGAQDTGHVKLNNDLGLPKSPSDCGNGSFVKESFQIMPICQHHTTPIFRWVFCFVSIIATLRADEAPKSPRATLGDDVEEPVWDKRLTVTVGPGDADIIGTNQRPSRQQLIM